MRDPDPVIFLEHKSLYATKGEVPDGESSTRLAPPKILRPGKDATICALALMVPRALQAAEKLKAGQVSIAKSSMCHCWCCSTRKPSSVRSEKTHRLFTVEENPRLCGWGAEIVSIVADGILL